MNFPGGLSRNPFAFSITPASLLGPDLYFPLSLAPAAFWNYARSDLGDIRVATQDRVTQVPRQIGEIDFVNKTGSLWIPKTAGATAYIVSFGNRQWTEPAANATYGGYGAWETALQIVAHLDNANDSTSYAHNATANTAGVTAGKIGSASSYNQEYTDWPSVGTLSSGGSLLCWINPTTYVQEGYIVSQGAGNSLAVASWDDGNIYLFCGGNALNIATTGLTGWHHFAITWNGTTFRTFLDGTFTISGAQGAGAITGPIRLGKLQSGGTVYAGKIDEFRLMSRPLSDGEVGALVANQSTPGAFWTAVGAVQQI